MEINETILTQLFVMKGLLDKRLEQFETEKEREAFIEGIHHTINLVFTTR